MANIGLKSNSGSDVAAKKKKNSAMPSKQTINFVQRQRNIDPKRLALGLVLALVVIAAIAKFGILDQESKRTAAKNELAAKQSSLESLNDKLEEYDDLAKEYGRYSYGLMNAQEKGLVERMDVLKLLEDNVMKVATVEDFALNENVLTLNIHGVTLDRASQIVKELESSPLVKSAAVYSASAEDAQQASIFMSVTLTKEANDK